MEIQKIFNEVNGEDKLYSVLLSEEEVALFSEFQRDFARKDYEGLSEEAAAKLKGERSHLAKLLRLSRERANESYKKRVESANRDMHESFRRRDGLIDKLATIDPATHDGKYDAAFIEYDLRNGLSEKNIREKHRERISDAVRDRKISYGVNIDVAEGNAKRFRDDLIKKESKSTPAHRRTQSSKVPTTHPTTSVSTPAPKGGKQEEIAKKSQNFISKTWKNLGTKGQIGVGIAGSALAAGAAYGAYKMKNKKKNDQDK